MKIVMGILAVAAMALVTVGCYDETEKPAETEGASTSANVTETKVSLETDLCGKCGCCAGCAECCKGEKCDKCEMQKGTLLCCSGVAPKDVVYCKGCGFEKGSESCCAASNEACTKCGLAKGAPICCKVKSDDDAAHDDDDDAHDDEGDGHDDDDDDHDGEKG